MHPVKRIKLSSRGSRFTRDPTENGLTHLITCDPRHFSDHKFDTIPFTAIIRDASTIYIRTRLSKLSNEIIWIYVNVKSPPSFVIIHINYTRPMRPRLFVGESILTWPIYRAVKSVRWCFYVVLVPFEYMKWYTCVRCILILFIYFSLNKMNNNGILVKQQKKFWWKNVSLTRKSVTVTVCRNIEAREIIISGGNITLYVSSILIFNLTLLVTLLVTEQKYALYPPICKSFIGKWLVPWYFLV